MRIFFSVRAKFDLKRYESGIVGWRLMVRRGGAGIDDDIFAPSGVSAPKNYQQREDT
jgi:hypothetical protein